MIVKELISLLKFYPDNMQVLQIQEIDTETMDKTKKPVVYLTDELKILIKYE